ncbi:Serpentine Receptor, class J [Caenorhabditis elegans]|uniref:Serpentine Receptor, class J n=1 Tax=Caenorhabditis elegans TaxID=6239 RepID=O17830_CAEEL|nr:Serpentine Receptor, class J [Caenorhabditis elegans]CAB05493.2 Serpentine Receptor, class J [Caenorhabditis elegans]|eukprot:NP_507048.2 Serpentine Receptor, class J [Caenorhabditis elegans]
MRGHRLLCDHTFADKNNIYNILNNSLSFFKFWKMRINWIHHYAPKISGSCSFVINLLSIYIAHDERKTHLGNYRILLIFFSIYNILNSTIDVFMPMSSLDYKYAFSYFITDGIFEKKSLFRTIALCLRGSFIFATYPILHAHFLYRYMVLFRSTFLSSCFIPYGIICSVSYCLTIIGFTFTMAYFWMVADTERLTYMQNIFLEEFNQNVDDLNIFIVIYHETSPAVLWKSWSAILILTTLSVISLVINSIFSILIITKLKSENLSMSNTTKRLQKQLIKALITQSTIPILVCFTPCLISWYLPVFGIDIGNGIHWALSVALSFFPVLDPLSLFFFLPIFGVRLREIFGIKRRVAIRTTDGTLHEESRKNNSLNAIKVNN